jgi:hypothetical protein
MVQDERVIDESLPRLGGELEPHDGSAADYVLRTAQQEMMAISALADQKANILLGVSLIIVTAVVGIMPSTGVTIALVVLGGSTVTAAILTLVCLFPSTGDRPDRARNPLYFADVGRMTFGEFRERMVGVLATSPSIYEAILRDLHESATAMLHHKYRYLRLAYGAFLVGLVLTVAAAVVDVAVGNI